MSYYEPDEPLCGACMCGEGSGYDHTCEEYGGPPEPEPDWIDEELYGQPIPPLTESDFAVANYLFEED